MTGDRRITVVGVACFVFAAAVLLVPLLALLVGWIAALADGDAPPGWEIRQLGLLIRSVMLALAGAAATLLLSLPMGSLIGTTWNVSTRRFVSLLAIVPLLVAPMLLAFGWRRVLPAESWKEATCVVVWASWTWPIPALMIGAGWRQVGKSAYEAAMCETGRVRAAWSAVAPALTCHAAIAGLLLFIVFLGEYTVPHACQMVVLSTELLGLATSQSRPAGVMSAALPQLCVVAAAFVLLAPAWRRMDWPAGGASESSSASTSVRGVTIAVGGATMLLVVFPIVSLWRCAGNGTAMVEAWATYRGELFATIGVALATAGVVVLVGFAVVGVQWTRRVFVSVALCLGVIPGALVGAAIVTAYRGAPVLYDHWPLVVAGFSARYAWIGVCVALLAVHAADRDAVDQALLDGASPRQARAWIQMLPAWRLFMAGAAVVAAFCIADIDVANIVQVPGIGLISLILIEKFHRFEDGMLAALGLWLIVPALVAALVVWMAGRRGAMLRA